MPRHLHLDSRSPACRAKCLQLCFKRVVRFAFPAEGADPTHQNRYASYMFLVQIKKTGNGKTVQILALARSTVPKVWTWTKHDPARWQRTTFLKQKYMHFVKSGRRLRKCVSILRRKHCTRLQKTDLDEIYKTHKFRTIALATCF